MAADAGHGPVGIAPTVARFPSRKLLHHIGLALARNGRNARLPLPGRPVTARTVGRVEGLRDGVGSRRDGPCGRLEAGVIFGDSKTFVHRQLPRDGAHLRMRSQPFVVESELANQIASVQPCQPRREVSIAFTDDTMANRAGIACSGIASGKGDDLAAFAISRRSAGVGRAGAEERQAGQAGDKSHCYRNKRLDGAVPLGMRIGGKIISAVALAALASCKPAPGDIPELDKKAAERGKLIAIEAQCAACHRMPGIDWPQGGLGPSLIEYGQGSMVAGVLPKQPSNLAQFVRNAPSFKTDSMMPAMNLSDRQARDIAHYLLMEGEK